jgi:hypothetical protein
MPTRAAAFPTYMGAYGGAELKSPHPKPIHRRTGAWAIVFHAAAVGCVWFIQFLGGSPSVTLVVGGLVVTCVFLTLALSEIRTTELSVTPLSFYFLWYSVSAGVSAIYIGATLSSMRSLAFVTARVAREDVATGYVIFLVGSVALHAGLQCFRPFYQCERASLRPDLPAGTMALTALYVAGILANFIPSLLRPLGSIGGILLDWTALTALSCFALTPAAELGLSRLRFGLMLFIGTAGLFSLNLFVSGSKAATMFSMLPMFWLFSVHPSLRRWLPVLGLAGVLVYSAVYQIITTARENLRGYKVSGYLLTGPDQIIDSISKVRQGGDTSMSINYQIDEFFNRQFEAVPVGFIVHEVREGGFMMGETMRYVFYMFIPRILWPDKPVVSRAGWFTYYLGLSESPASATTGTGQSAQGELYWNFGLAGVVIGMFFIGSLLGGLWRLAGTDPHRKPVRMMLYVLTTVEMQMLVEAGTAIDAAIARFLIFGTALWLLRISAGRPTTALPFV